MSKDSWRGLDLSEQVFRSNLFIQVSGIFGIFSDWMNSPIWWRMGCKGKASELENEREIEEVSQDVSATCPRI